MMDISDKCKRDGSTGLFQRLTFCAAICAAALVPVAANAAAYTEGMDSITLTVPSDGTTNTLAEAIAAYNADNNTSYTVSSFNGGDLKDYALIKEGDGTLVMDTAIANYTGPVVIKDGVLKCDCTNALGADTTSSHVYVRDGATFFVKRIADSDNIKNNNRNLHIAGDGHNGQGALNVDKARKSNSWNATGIYGKVLYLDDDATAVHPSWAALANPVYLNGHTLVVKSADKFSSLQGLYCDATYQAATLNGPGKMVIDDSIYYLSGTTLNDTTPGNEIEVRNNGGFRFWKGNYTGYNWIIRFTGETAWLFGDNNDARMRFGQDANATTIYNARRNRIGSPMILTDTTLKMRTQSGIWDNWVFLEGPISGRGNINLECASWQFPAHRLSLLNPANSFIGTATVDKGLLYVYEPGSLPSTVQLVVSRSHALDYKLQKTECVPEYFGAEFLSPNPQTLNSLTFTSVADGGTYHSGRIQGGCGTFSKIDKLSPNTMEYYSGIGSPLLNVEGGTVKLPRGPAPGLWEGTNKSDIVQESNPGSYWGAVFSSRRVATNLVARGPLIANFELFPHYAAPIGSPVTYSGYLWNRYGQDVTVTLVSSMSAYTRLYIDDVAVIEQNTYSGADNAYDQVFTNLTLTTGPHKFEYRTTGSPCISNNWDRMLGFAIDPMARGESSDTNNFYTIVDPGDGSLFTRSLDEADLPHFDEMRFADGTTLDLNGNAYVASTISGFPNVISTAEDASAAPSLTITNRFIVNAADLVVGSTTNKMSLAVPLAFSASASVNLTNDAGVRRMKYTIAEVTGEGNAISIGDRTRLPCDADSSKWVVQVSDDGKRLELSPAGGLIIHVR